MVTVGSGSFNLFALLLPIIFGITYASGDDTSSPLATWDPSGSTTFTTATVGTGTLNITDTCVWLEVEGTNERILLVWPEPTSWNAETSEITFVNQQGESINLKNGDTLTPGGAESTWNRPFVVPPNPACEADVLFILNDVTLDTQH